MHDEPLEVNGEDHDGEGDAYNDEGEADGEGEGSPVRIGGDCSLSEGSRDDCTS